MDHLIFFDTLNQHKVKYLVCGGLAVNLHGVRRTTADVDIILDLNVENIKNFESAIKKYNYSPIIPIPLNSLIDKNERLKLKKEKNLIAYSYQTSYNRYMNLDVLIDCPFSFEEMWNAKNKRSGDGHYMYYVSLEHLIELKKYSGRIQDKEDVINLMRFENESDNTVSEPAGEYIADDFKESLEWVTSINNLLDTFQTPEEKARFQKLRSKS